MRKIDLTRPSLWYSEVFNTLRIFYPNGTIEFISLRSNESEYWCKSEWSSKNNPKNVFEFMVTFGSNKFVSYL